MIFINLSALDGLTEFIEMIKDFVLSIINGLSALVSALIATVNLTGTFALWMPTVVASYIVIAAVMISILRIIGR